MTCRCNDSVDSLLGATAMAVVGCFIMSHFSMGIGNLAILVVDAVGAPMIFGGLFLSVAVLGQVAHVRSKRDVR